MSFAFANRIARRIGMRFVGSAARRPSMVDRSTWRAGHSSAKTGLDLIRPWRRLGLTFWRGNRGWWVISRDAQIPAVAGDPSGFCFACGWPRESWFVSLAGMRMRDAFYGEPLVWIPGRKSHFPGNCGPSSTGIIRHTFMLIYWRKCARPVQEAGCSKLILVIFGRREYRVSTFSVEKVRSGSI